MNEETKYELTTTDEFGRVTLSENVVNIYETIAAKQNEADALMNSFREQLLTAMIANFIPSVKIGKLTCSQVIPSDTVKFDVEKFMLNESQEVVASFTEVETTEMFDIEKFKSENPDMYKKYTTVTDTPNVNTSKLEKALPAVYEKYVTRIKSDKPIRLMMKESKK